MASGLVTMMGASPDIAPLATPLATFIKEGGKLHISLKPTQPMTFSGIAEKFSGPSASPGQTLKELGLKVEHSK
jgi:hypothetical protein